MLAPVRGNRDFGDKVADVCCIEGAWDDGDLGTLGNEG